jgi:hypothetical protein
MKLMWFHLMPYTELPDEDRWWPQPMDHSARAPLSAFQPAAMAAE